MSRERTGPFGDLTTPGIDAAGARWRLAEKVSRTFSAPPERPDTETVVRVAVAVEAVAPLAWLGEQRLYPRSYWSGREDAGGVAAVGVADVRTGDAAGGIDGLRKNLTPPPAAGDARVRYYGGMRFDAARGSARGSVDGWDEFGGYSFVLPRFELRAGADGATLACNLVLPRDLDRREEIVDQIEDLRPPGNPADRLPRPISRRDTPDRDGWDTNVRRALAAFSGGRLGKVVLARRAELGFTENLDGVLLARELERATPGCFHFYVEPVEGVAFLGASPERLFRREGRLVQSEAVAGTRPRGASSGDDEDLRADLLRSEKDRAEHGFVRDGIREALRPLSDELQVEDGVSEMKLASRRHLVSRVRGTLREGVGDAEVLRALHPTPAVGGYPGEEALGEIRDLEAFDRGWYAGPIGWIGSDESEFAVGIRSGLVKGRKLALFSGAGIVPGSRPEAEWDEIEQKIEDFTGAFGLGHRPGQRQGQRQGQRFGRGAR